MTTNKFFTAMALTGAVFLSACASAPSDKHKVHLSSEDAAKMAAVETIYKAEGIETKDCLFHYRDTYVLTNRQGDAVFYRRDGLLLQGNIRLGKGGCDKNAVFFTPVTSTDISTVRVKHAEILNEQIDLGGQKAWNAINKPAKTIIESLGSRPYRYLVVKNPFGFEDPDFSSVLWVAEWATDFESQRVTYMHELVAKWDAKAKAKTEKKQKAKEESKRNFERASAAPLSVGDRVCTWGNYVGTVEQVGGDNVKVAFIGRIRSRAPNGAMFNPLYRNFSITSNPELEWIRKDKVGVCDVYR